MYDQNLAIVDIETTGLNGVRNRIIELAIIRVEKNKIVDKYTTLINPQTRVSPFIQNFTGISQQELLEAPIFLEVKKRVLELLTDAVFVAHNVRFDYTFIRTEFKRLGIPFRTKTCCTVKLSRRLFPRYKRHGLAAIIERYGFRYKNRHRAYDDAYVLWQFLQKIKKNIPKRKILETWKSLTQTVYSSDKNILKQINSLPEAPGVYLFYDRRHKVMYVGKSKNISHRVISHFSEEDHHSAKHLAMMRNIANIEYVQTSGQLGTAILESNLIKEAKPAYNGQQHNVIPQKQISPWPYKGPIKIVEKDEEYEKYEVFTIDQWCLIGNKKGENDEEKYEPVFDLDKYRIISRYLSNQKNNINVWPQH